MTLVEKELVTAREISEAEEIFDDPTNPDPTSSWHQYIFPYLPVTYLGILCIVGIISNSLVIFFFAACPVVSHFFNSSKPALAVNAYLNKIALHLFVQCLVIAFMLTLDYNEHDLNIQSIMYVLQLIQKIKSSKML